MFENKRMAVFVDIVKHIEQQTQIDTEKIFLENVLRQGKTTSRGKQNAGFKQWWQTQKSGKLIFTYKYSLSHNETVTDSNSYCLSYF